MRAWLNLRYTNDRRAQLFKKGLRAGGFEPKTGLCHAPQPGDMMVTWNRIGLANRVAENFIKKGNKVIVVENASFGNDFNGERWYHMALYLHNTAGQYPLGSPSRWDDLKIKLAPFRTEGETVILSQRGIGSAPTKMPRDWPQKAQKKYGGRIRSHPGRRTTNPIESDLSVAGRVITWGSGGAIKALLMGIRVISHMPNWIGEQDNTEHGRLEMLRRLIWAQWRHDEIENGAAFRHLLGIET